MLNCVSDFSDDLEMSEFTWNLPGGRGRREHTILPNFSQKLHEIENILVRVGTPIIGQRTKSNTGRARLIRSHSSARFCFELSGNLN